MDWILVILLLVAVYAVAAFTIWQRGLWKDHLTFYGPILALKSTKVGFFDRFSAYSTFLRLYASFGVVMVGIISVGITIMLFVSLQFTFITRPEPTGIYAPQNILLIPGINEYVPSTIAVWFAFVLTIAIHEFGHGILCRVEKIAVRSVGALLLVIPIGFFVEPDEEELDRTKGLPKIRMFGAGITNNIVVGVACFIVMILLMGMVVPSSEPVIGGVYQNYSASEAGVPPYSIIKEVNGIPVENRQQVADILAATRPGDQLALAVETGGAVTNHTLTLSAWPAELGTQQSGFMGVSYYDSAAILSAISESVSPIGFLRLLTVPFDLTLGGQSFRILAFDTPALSFYEEPFPGFFGLIHLLFWCGWININVGIFNAIPMIPLDGGYILKESVERLFERRGISQYARPVVSFISTFMIVMLFSIIALPYLFSLAPAG